MGIKQFLEQQGGGLDNIRDIRIPTEKKQKELPFDPDEEITEAEWQWLLTYGGQNIAPTKRASIMAAMAILSPDRIKKLPQDDFFLGTLIEELDERQKYLINEDTAEFKWKRSAPRLEWSHFSSLAVSVQILFPEKATRINLNSNVWDGALKSLQKLKAHDAWSDFTNLAADIRMLYPSQKRDKYLESEDWSGMKKTLELFRGGEWGWFFFAKQAMAMKILFPEKEKELNLNEAAWRGMKKQLKRFRNENNVKDFAELIKAMKILAAHKVEVTENGLEITMRDPAEDFREEREPMPVRLSF